MEELIGIVEHIIFRNEENGYTVFTLSVDGEEIDCTGQMESLRPGSFVMVRGQYTEHAAYGMQFRVTYYENRMPEGSGAILRYLQSGAVKGIGKALGKRIVDRFGDDTLDVMKEEPERLTEIKGISMRKAQEIAGEMNTQEDLRQAMLFLSKYDIPYATGLRIYQMYGQAMYGILQENPYQLAEEVDGIGFKTADEIAAKMGVRADDRFRIRAAILYVLMEAAGEGHLCLPRKELIHRVDALIACGDDLPETEIDNLAVEHRVVLYRDHEDQTQSVYHAYYYEQELHTARMLMDLSAIVSEDEDGIREIMDRAASGEEITLAPEQEEAVYRSLRYGLSIITGGPGTGKTTTIRQILRVFAMQGKEIMLAAPTGRAARRLSETTGHPASTIHRLLEIGPMEEEKETPLRFGRNEERPLEGDVLIVDEVSMVDLPLMCALLRALTPGISLVLVGDADQLPSIGPGHVLHDLITSDLFPATRLKTIFRQAAQSDIVLCAHAINRGEHPTIDNHSRDLFFLQREDLARIVANTIELMTGKLSDYVEASSHEIQVLTPKRRGTLGVEHLNAVLQAALNPPKEGTEELIYGDLILRPGDKVMQIKNDYQLRWEVRGKYGIAIEEGEGVFNGDIGTVRDIDMTFGVATVEYDEGRMVEYTKDMLPLLSLAYAITIHKAQGSEYPAVILPLLSGPPMLYTRNLLYTALTRARRCVIVLGRRDLFDAMIDNARSGIRYTHLSEQMSILAGGIPSGGGL